MSDTTHRRGLTIPPELWDPLTELASVRHTSAAAIVRELVRREVIAARKRDEIEGPARRRRAAIEEESA